MPEDSTSQLALHTHSNSTCNRHLFQLQGYIELRNLSFGYSKDEPSLIEGFNFTLKPGQRVAIVGKSGSGKSTIAKLLAGLYLPWEGDVFFDGVPRSQISRSILSKSIAVVEQDIFLFSGTIRENLTLWNSTIPKADLVRACQDAAIHETIVSLPGGYDAKIIERGMNFSGGERQRLEIARSLVRNPAVLILDEATSALDAQTELIIDRNLRLRGCSCVIVAHRLSTIRDCDEIIVLENGKVVQKGTHDELWQQGGAYARLLSAEEFNNESPPIIEEATVRDGKEARTQLKILPEALSQDRAQKLKDRLPALNPSLVREIRWIQGSKPMLLDDPETLWRVDSGSLALFLTKILNGELQGNRQYLFSVSAGEAVFGVKPLLGDRPDEQWGILAVAIEQTSLQQVSIADLAAEIVAENSEAISLLTGWMNHITQLISTKSELSSTPIQVSESIDLSLSMGQTLQSQSETLAWVDIRQGNACWMGVETLIVNPKSSVVPLGCGMWLEAQNPVEIEIRSTLELERNRDAIQAGLTASQQYFLGYLHFQAQKDYEEEWSRFNQLQELNSQFKQQAFHELVTVLQPEQSSFYQEGDPLLVAANVVCESLGITMRSPLELSNYRSVESSVESIARSSKFSTRQVALLGKWWNQEYGPLLAFTQEDNYPVALLPNKSKGYVLFEPGEKIQIPVNARVATALAAEAYMFYRLLPQSINRAIEVFRFGIEGYGRDIITLISVGIMGTLLGMITPQATALLVSQVIPDSDRVLLWQIGLGLLAATIGRSTFQFIQGILVLRVENVADSVLQPAVWERLLSLSPAFFRQYTSGDLMLRLLTVSQIRRLLSGATLRTLLSGIFSLLNVGLMFTYSTSLTFVALGITLIPIGITISSGLSTLRKERMYEQVSAEINSITVQLINGIQKLRVAAAEERAFAVWAKKFRLQTLLVSDIKKIHYTVAVISEVIPVLISVIIFRFAFEFMLVAQIDGSANGLTMGTFLAFNAAFGIFIIGVTDISNTITDILRIIPLWERAKPILQTPAESNADRTDSNILKGRVALDCVTFHYRESESPTVNNISMYADPGEFIAIVGPSGSGKSTLFRLLLGFETPQSGTIHYDGQNLSQLDVRSLRQQMGVVLQNAQVLTGSIFDNITCGGMVSMDEAWAAARMVGLADDIEQMPMGMFTIVSEGGSNISVGQRQRISIARALISKPKIILMDEATSALDNRTQAIITESLAQLNTTRIVIAHRLSTIRHADRIYVIESGRVVQTGSFELLASQDGLFARLVARQIV